MCEVYTTYGQICTVTLTVVQSFMYKKGFRDFQVFLAGRMEYTIGQYSIYMYIFCQYLEFYSQIQ